MHTPTNYFVKLQNRIADERDADERGAAMAEYGLLIALVALAAIAVLILFGGSIVSVFQGTSDVLSNAVSS